MSLLMYRTVVLQSLKGFQFTIQVNATRIAWVTLEFDIFVFVCWAIIFSHFNSWQYWILWQVRRMPNTNDRLACHFVRCQLRMLKGFMWMLGKWVVYVGLLVSDKVERKENNVLQAYACGLSGFHCECGWPTHTRTVSTPPPLWHWGLVSFISYFLFLFCIFKFYYFNCRWRPVLPAPFCSNLIYFQYSFVSYFNQISIWFYGLFFWLLFVLS